MMIQLLKSRKRTSLSSPNSSYSGKRRFSDNIELLKNNDKLLYKKAEESINKAYEYYKLNNRTYDISNMLLYYITNSK